MNEYAYHYEGRVMIPATQEAVFSYLDDHTRLSSHMSKPSWTMGGGSMQTVLDEAKGKRVGSHIRISGKAFGIKIYLDEVVTVHEPPRRKIWETVGELRLLVIGDYQMAFEVTPQGRHSSLCVSIDYNMPKRNAWLGALFGGLYAKWCVNQMLKDAQNHFTAGKQ